MPDLMVATAAVIAFVSVSCFAIRRKKRDALARIEAEPAIVSRLYLRADPDLEDVYWLHAELANGKRRLIAAPWNIEGTLARLESLGLRLSPEDQAALEHLHAREDVPSGPSRRLVKAPGVTVQQSALR